MKEKEEEEEENMKHSAHHSLMIYDGGHGLIPIQRALGNCCVRMCMYGRLCMFVATIMHMSSRRS